ncbi:DNA gyrase inhibitor YacG [Halodurantibacterium flavum]|uniref:DNA gyrase inhibitor YacG n=1 Tax=Halodurantibacterium flavum TaxID=1382802 RepID=A0ABW4S3L0_9RHOB
MTCPICNRETDPKYRPFCSRRCADVDLGRWLTGAYVVPAEAVEEDEDAAGDNPEDDRLH